MWSKLGLAVSAALASAASASDIIPNEFILRYSSSSAQASAVEVFSQFNVQNVNTYSFGSFLGFHVNGTEKDVENLAVATSGTFRPNRVISGIEPSTPGDDGPSQQNAQCPQPDATWGIDRV